MKLITLSAVVAVTLLLPLCAAADTKAVDLRRRNEQGVAAFSKGDYALAVDAFADL